jgi:sugar lactone lactonase YvrE
MEILTPGVLLAGLAFPECPRWHDGKIWFSDQVARKVMTVDLEGRSAGVVSVPEVPAGLGFLPDSQLLVVSVRDRRLLRLDPDGLHVVADMAGLEDSEINDMVVDSQGRAYIGSPSRVYRISPDGSAAAVADGLSYANGMVITPDGQRLIVAETLGRCLTVFDISADGGLFGRRPFVEAGAIGGALPDGICLDAEGAVWVGSPATSEFVRVREGGAVSHRIPVPGRWAVACMLGGEDRRTLFLCTAETTWQDLYQGKSVGWIETAYVEVPGAGRP